MRLTEPARAKINLTLRVLGRCADGYHALESLVSFASVADEVTLDLAQPLGIETHGAFAGAIEGENLLARVLSQALALAPGLRVGRIFLRKALPVAAGIGGGSADAAALLRALQRANPEARLDWMALAASLGADVPVCLADRPMLMWGRGEGLAELPEAAVPHRPMAAVLVNPRLPLSTRDVFAALRAAPLERSPGTPQALKLKFNAIDDLRAYLAAVGNDLEAPALRLLPAIGAMKAALARQAGCVHAAMSGSGPTCFGLFATAAAAERGAAALQNAEAGWWVQPTQVDFPAGQPHISSPG